MIILKTWRRPRIETLLKAFLKKTGSVQVSDICIKNFAPSDGVKVWEFTCKGWNPAEIFPNAKSQLFRVYRVSADTEDPESTPEWRCEVVE